MGRLIIKVLKFEYLYKYVTAASEPSILILQMFSDIKI